MKRHDYYRILHVQSDAPEEVIKASHRALMRQLQMHPDLGGDHLHATLINEAFRVLSDVRLRAAYDAHHVPVDPKTGMDQPPADALSPCIFCGAHHAAVSAHRLDATCSSCGAAICLVARHSADRGSRRAIDRAPRSMRMTFRRAGAPNGSHKAATHDISLSGMRFLTLTRLEIEERLLIECDFCSAVGIVRSVRRHAVEHEGWECGAQFLSLRVKHQRGSLLSKVG